MSSQFGRSRQCLQSGMSRDSLVGALRLRVASPRAIRDLASQRPEQETFRFGEDGRTQKRAVRFKLPTLAEEDLILTWVSAVPVGSLGFVVGVPLSTPAL